MIDGFSIIGATLVLIIVSYFLYVQHVNKLKIQEKIDASNKQRQQQQNDKNKNKAGSDNKTNTKSDNNVHISKKQRVTDSNYSHPWLFTTLKGHTGKILDMDFSTNGKYLATCSEDRTLLVWSTKDLGNTKDRKSFRVNVQYDHGEKICWSPDNRALLIHKFTQRAVEVYKFERTDSNWFTNPTKSITFSEKHVEDIVGFGISCTGRFIMTCSNKNDLILWDTKGNVLATLDTFLLNTYCAKISNCGKFVTACGWNTDVRVWEVKFDKTNEFQAIQQAFDLTGHKSSVYDVAFNHDSSFMATICKDNSWNIFNTRIEYAKGESARRIVQGVYEQSTTRPQIAISPQGNVVAITKGGSVMLYSVKTGLQDILIENIYTEITSIKFDEFGKFLYTTGDKYVRIFHNITGYKESLLTAQEKLKQTKTSAMKDRLEQQIGEYEEIIEKYNH
uniref:Putative ws beta-transducin repeat protein n=1 Tax=Corethrella appendiculata TaxID=1370023 RepID=U5EHC5_9DIPT